MPTYSFSCGGCGKRSDVVASMSRATTCAPFCCGRLMLREFGVPQVSGDAYASPRLVSSLNALDGDPGKSPTFESRSQERAYLRAHNERFGTGYEY